MLASFPPGRGALYGAVDQSSGRLFAIKAMTANPEKPEFSLRFAREAAAMAMREA